MKNTTTKDQENKNKIPSKMARIAWPKAKYGVYLAIFIIIFVTKFLTVASKGLDT